MAILNGVPTWLLGIAAVLFMILIRVSLSSSIKRDGVPLRKPPNTLPLVGNGILFLQARQKLFSWFVKCERQFGYETFQISVPTLPPGVVINDPRNLEFVFKHEGVFGKGDFVKRRSWDLFGNGIINADGELWRVQRKAGLSFLNTANLRVLTDVALPQYLTKTIDSLKSCAADGRVVDLQSVFHGITTQLMGKMAYNMEMQADGDFTAAFEYASGATAERFQNPLWFITEIFFGANFRKSISIVKRFGKDIVASAIRDRRRERRSDDAGKEDGDDNKLDAISGSLIQSLLDSIGDEQMVADAALNYLSAGRDTTAQALTWTFYLLMNNPSVASKIRAEVSQVLAAHQPPGSTTPTPSTTLFTPTSMPYTTAVFYESLRLYPPIPFEIKQCVSATTLPDGTFLPADAVVVWCPWAMGRSRTTWGADAEAFRPERWLSDDDNSSGSNERHVVARSAATFPVFNGGPRTCLGKRMAEAVAVQTMAALAWRFDFRAADEAGRERVSRSSLTLPMEGGLPCIVLTQD